MKCRATMYASTAIAVVAASCYTLSAIPAFAQDSSVETVVVLGVRGAEKKAMDLKRAALSIQDSIAAEDIGKLPDTTISDSLQRITGVQIDRSAGEGTGINIRGLPEVGNMLNGEAFLTTSNIVDVQPNFGDVPSQLFSGADVVKSPTASLLNSGITGTVNLKTRRPWDMAQGWTLAGTLEGAHGFNSKKYEPLFNGLVNYNGGRWGVLVSVAASDVTLENSVNGIDTYGGEIFTEAGGSCNGCTGNYNGFVGGWGSASIPSAMHYNSSTGSVDINNNGESTDAFYGTENVRALDREIERKRVGFNVSAQGDLGNGFTVTGDFFYTFQKQFQRSVGYELDSYDWLGATFIPTTYRDTGTKVYGGWNGGSSSDPTYNFYTMQAFTKYVGALPTWSEDDVTTSSSRNYSLQLAYDGGRFSAEVRAIYADARELNENSYLTFTTSDGSGWSADGSTTYYNTSGAFTFNKNGLPVNTVAVGVDYRGDNIKLTMPTLLTQTLANPDAYALQTVASENNHDRASAMNALRFDGHYRFSDNARLDFGVRESFRGARNEGFALVAPMYGGTYAYNSDGSINSTGCYVHWKAADVLMNASSCYAQIGGHYLTANPLAGETPYNTPSIVSKHIKKYSNVGGVEGVSFYAMDPKAMDNVEAFQNSLYPGEVRDIAPGQTWRVSVAQTAGYVQGSFNGDIAVGKGNSMPFDFNAGMRVVETWLDVDQHNVGSSGNYGTAAKDLGITETKRTFTNYLPAVNFSLELIDNLKFRMAYSRNMQLLNLSQWGGALTVYYGKAGSVDYAALGGNQDGNPYLKPWASSNYDMSLEYYYSQNSMVNIALFYIDVDSFIYTGSTTRCDLADMDGVVRRCASISGPVQGSGKALKGVEIGNKQAFDFLPGIWGNFGAEINFTFSPSNSGGKDMAGNTVPFQDNSKWQSNFVIWYQDDAFQARLAANYRSKRAVASNIGGISGFEEYQTETFYLDASASYDFTENFTLYAQGSNILGEKEHYYYVWTDQKANTTRFEPRVTLGVRARF